MTCCLTQWWPFVRNAEQMESFAQMVICDCCKKTFWGQWHNESSLCVLLLIPVRLLTEGGTTKCELTVQDFNHSGVNIPFVLPSDPHSFHHHHPMA